MANAATWILHRISFDSVALIAVPLACACCPLVEAYLRTDVGDADSASYCRYPPLKRLLCRKHVRQLEQTGFVVFQDSESVLRDGILAATQRDIVSLCLESRRFHGTANDTHARQDLVCWLRESDGTPLAVDPNKQELKPLGPGILHCIKMLRGIAHELEAHGYEGSHLHRVPKQLQLGWYRGDGRSGYVRHLDSCNMSVFELGLVEWLRLSDYRERSVTAILYLNDPHWGRRADGDDERANDGGELRCYHVPELVQAQSEADGQATNSGEHKGNLGDVHVMAQGYTDVIPRGGTLIVFDSRRVHHEVLPARRDRFALTCWIAGKEGPVE